MESFITDDLIAVVSLSLSSYEEYCSRLANASCDPSARSMKVNWLKGTGPSGRCRARWRLREDRERNRDALSSFGLLIVKEAGEYCCSGTAASLWPRAEDARP